MSTTNPRGRPPAGTGLRAALAAAGLVVAGTAASAAAQTTQDCRQELERIEAQAAGADLTLAQHDYIRDLIDSARTFAANGNVRGGRQTVVDLAEYVQEEGIDMPLAREARDWAPLVADTPENLRDRPPEPEINLAQSEPRVGETSVPLPVPEPSVTVERADPEVRVERAEPRVEVERAEPNVSVEQAEPNVTIEQAEPRVTIERTGAGEQGR